MTIVYVILIVLAVCMATCTAIMVSTIKRLKSELADSQGECNSVKQMLAGKNRRAEDVVTESEKSGDSIFDGMVEKIARKRNNKVIGYSYKIKEGSVPEFKDVGGALSYISGFLRKPEDPTVANLTGLGCVMKTDEYVGMKLVLRNVLYQVDALRGKKEGDKTEDCTHEFNEDGGPCIHCGKTWIEIQEDE